VTKAICCRIGDTENARTKDDHTLYVQYNHATVDKGNRLTSLQYPNTRLGRGGAFYFYR
jgi:hypothetical protein